jgi:hypothetical protein
LSCSNVIVAPVVLAVDNVLFIAIVIVSLAASARPLAPGPVVFTNAPSTAVKFRDDDSVITVAPSVTVAAPLACGATADVKTVHRESSEPAVISVIVEPAGTPSNAHVVDKFQLDTRAALFLTASDELRQPVGLPPVADQESVTLVPAVAVNPLALLIKLNPTDKVAI